MAKVRGSYVVVPAEQIDGQIEGKGIPALPFPKASLASQFVEDVQAFARKRAGQLLNMGLTKEDKESMSDEEVKAHNKKTKEALNALPQVVPFDVLIQKLDEDGKPDGDPIEFETFRD